DILPEPAQSRKIMEDIAGDRKLARDRHLKLEMAPEEVVSAQRQVWLWHDNRQAGHCKSAIGGNLLTTPRLLYTDSDKKQCRQRIVAQIRSDIVGDALHQRIVGQDTGERSSRWIYDRDGIVAFGME